LSRNYKDKHFAKHLEQLLLLFNKFTQKQSLVSERTCLCSHKEWHRC